jgi:hypothetical protein
MKIGLIVAVAGLAVVLLVMFLRKRRREAHAIGPKRDSRGERQKSPFFRREVVERKIRSFFPETDPGRVLELLEANVTTAFCPERTQLALLKLSDGNLDELRRLSEMVTRAVDLQKPIDFQLIGMAEWPEAHRMGYDYVNLFPEEQEPAFKRDLHQYLRWVRR